MAKKQTGKTKASPKGRQLWRVPDEGPVTPRLRVPDRQTSAIGFHIAPHDQDDGFGDE